MKNKPKVIIDGYLQSTVDLHRSWNQQEAEICGFIDAVEPLYNRIEGADCRAGEKTTLEFTPVELTTLLEAVGCAFEYQKYRRIADEKSLEIEVVQQIIGNENIKSESTKYKIIKSVITPSIFTDEPSHNNNHATEFLWLIGQVPENIESFFDDELKRIKRAMRNKEIPVSKAKAKKILADIYYKGEIDSCRKAIYRARVEQKITVGDEESPSF